MLRGYKTSQDYHRLKELLDEGYRIVVLFFDDEVAEMLKGNTSWPAWKYGPPYAINGCDHKRLFNANSFEEFEQQCIYFRIEFIEPTDEKESIEAGTPMLDASSVGE